MLFLNFLCRTSSGQFGRVAELCNAELSQVRIVDFNVQLDFHNLEGASDLIALLMLSRTGLTLEQFRSHRLVVALPRHPLVSAIVLSVLAGMSGQWPMVLNVDTRGEDPRFMSLVDLDLINREGHRPQV